jgi:hypothetical protein
MNAFRNDVPNLFLQNGIVNLTSVVAGSETSNFTITAISTAEYVTLPLFSFFETIHGNSLDYNELSSIYILIEQIKTLPFASRQTIQEIDML